MDELTVRDQPSGSPVGWSSRLAVVLGDVGPRVRRLAEQVGRDWPDPTGREWAERATAVHRELDRIVAEATELAHRSRDDRERALPTVEPAVGPWVEPSEGPWAGRVGRRSGALPGGPRLGGTAGGVAEDEPGVRLGELPPPP